MQLPYLPGFIIEWVGVVVGLLLLIYIYFFLLVVSAFGATISLQHDTIYSGAQNSGTDVFYETYAWVVCALAVGRVYLRPWCISTF